MKTICQCGQPIEYGHENAGISIACPSCEAPVNLVSYQAETLELPPLPLNAMPQAGSRPQCLAKKVSISFGTIFFYMLGGLIFFPCLLLMFGDMVASSQQKSQGMASILLFFPMMIGAGLAALGHFFRKYSCPQCGNAVTATSKVCPTCRAALR